MEKSEIVLIVDDDEMNRDLLNDHLETLEYQVIEAENGKIAIEKAIIEQPDLIIMDIMMPVMNGYQAIKELKSIETTKNIPIVIATALGSREEKLEGITIGADDYLTKPIDIEELAVRVKNNLAKKKYTDLLNNQNEILYKKVLQKTKEIQDAFIETTHRLTLAAEYKDPETGEHIKRISIYTKELAMEMGQPQSFVDTIHYASAMHDIGKVGIPDSILLKPGPLDEQEWSVMQKHTEIGSKIFYQSSSPLLKMAYEIAYAHHEKWNGSGYPRGLKQEEIALPARMMMICDQYDALRSNRPYKSSLSHEKTMDILQNGDGRTLPEHFDPRVLSAFAKVSDRFNDIYTRYSDNSAGEE